MGCAQAIQCQHFQRRWAVDKNIIVAFPQRLQNFSEAVFPVVHVNQLHSRAGQGAGAGQNVAKFGSHYQLFRFHAVDNCMVYGFSLPLFHAQAGRGVCLGVKVAQQYAFSRFLQGGGEIDGGGGFAHAAFLIDNCDDFSQNHASFLFLYHYITDL